MPGSFFTSVTSSVQPRTRDGDTRMRQVPLDAWLLHLGALWRGKTRLPCTVVYDPCWVFSPDEFRWKLTTRMFADTYTGLPFPASPWKRCDLWEWEGGRFGPRVDVAYSYEQVRAMLLEEDDLARASGSPSLACLVGIVSKASFEDTLRERARVVPSRYLYRAPGGQIYCCLGCAKACGVARTDLSFLPASLHQGSVSQVCARRQCLRPLFSRA